MSVRNSINNFINKSTSSILLWERIQNIKPNVSLKRKNVLENVLKDKNIDPDIIESILNDGNIIKTFLQVSQSSAVRRGIELNIIVEEICKDSISNYCKKENINVKLDFLLKREYCYNGISEKLDFYIEHLPTGKKLLFLNQIDFWFGGQQSNRGQRYIHEDKYNEICKNNGDKCIYVVAKPYDHNCSKMTNNKTKKYNLFKTGIDNNTLYYPNELNTEVIIPWIKNILT